MFLGSSQNKGGSPWNRNPPLFSDNDCRHYQKDNNIYCLNVDIRYYPNLVKTKT